MVIVNGEKKQGFEGKSVEELVFSLGYKMTFIAVEYNGEILPKTEYANTVLKENDKIEVVSFVGGG